MTEPTLLAAAPGDSGAREIRPGAAAADAGSQPQKLTADLDRLARMIRTAPRFLDAVRWWAGFPLRGELLEPAVTHELSEASAILLDLPPGTRVLRRELRLLGAMSGPPFTVATVSEYVHEALLGADLGARRALREGGQPVDDVLDGLHRAAYLLTRPAAGRERQKADLPALFSHAVLSGAGRPVALTTEAVYRQLVAHRAPDTIPHYAARIPRAARITP
ncbi:MULTISPECIES: hypothetical protein [unclassified Amycolatopsis]|uniref:hypothetical protein n=1 Tax=unclassified Amycolatopsis TaxID=2618356 RepID=UPI0028769435|nr:MULTISPECIES: hypothetical protein [unclassified Amycolatopsis]MDS0140596.1 hypothetical protein [Amycolatopsis sp. 505]MDS0149246.1 hypothetical protein [Amycolatopsis sp. CM201R]